MNPHNNEPKFEPDATDGPSWDATLNRWTIFDARKIILKIGNFLDFSPTELIRGISIILDLQLMSPATSLSDPTSRVEVGLLSSDVSIRLEFSKEVAKYYLFMSVNQNAAWTPLF